MTTKDITVYAKEVFVGSNGEDVQIHLNGVDTGQIVQEFSNEELLDAIVSADGLSDIVIYASRRMNDEE